MTLSDIKKMQLGQIVDYCIEYNERQRKADEAAEQAAKKKDKPKKRKATQADINTFFG